MKIFLISFLTTVSIAFTGMFYEKHPLDSLGKILQFVAEKVELKHRMMPIGTSIASPDGILKRVGLEFKYNQQMSKKEFSEILFEIATLLLEKINENEEIRPSLDHYPFDYSDISIVIFLMKENGRFIDPDYTDVALEYGSFIFHTNDPSTKFGYKTTIKEPIHHNE
jgi:hypothetical protein